MEITNITLLHDDLERFIQKQLILTKIMVPFQPPKNQHKPISKYEIILNYQNIDIFGLLWSFSAIWNRF